MVGLFKTDRGNISRCNVCWHLHAGGEPAVDIHEALAMTVPGIVANDSARRGGEQLKVPCFDPA
jgi:hypothetical protein